MVPGSHNRPDTDAERALFPHRPVPAPDLATHLSSTEREVACQEYVRQMPGAVQVVLCAGDVAFYRNTGWHIGTYVPYVKRATLHDGFLCDEDYAVRGEGLRRIEEIVRAKAHVGQPVTQPRLC
jgi:hypothetical protein